MHCDKAYIVKNGIVGGEAAAVLNPAFIAAVRKEGRI